MDNCTACVQRYSYRTHVFVYAVPPDAPNITAVYSLSPTQLTVVWSPASTGSFPTSFSVSISANASLINTAIVGADERSHIFNNLTSSTNYTVSVAAINCAGNSSAVYYTGVTGEGDK